MLLKPQQAAAGGGPAGVNAGERQARRLAGRTAM